MKNQVNNLFNETKQEILGIIRTLGEVTSLEVSLVTGRSPSACSMALFRYFNMGLLHRQTLKGRTKIYELTAKGRERLEWLEQSL